MNKQHLSIPVNATIKSISRSEKRCTN